MTDSRRDAQGLRPLEARRFEAGSEPRAHRDVVVVEEPLEIRVAGDTLAITMRTPGHDEELAAGFLHAEGLIASRADLGQIAHCGRPGEEGFGNTIDVLPAPGTAIDLERAAVTRRGTLTTAACGVCGRRTIDDLLGRCAALDDSTTFSRSLLGGLTEALRARQTNFEKTGGLHAAGLARPSGEYVHVREDIGRHNAVDKLVGRLLLDNALPARGSVLVVSGRTSFEIVQKALVARIPVVVSVSAASSLAVETARRAGMTLIGFSRQGSFNVYAGEERVVG